MLSASISAVLSAARLVVLSPAGAFPSRNWPTERYARGAEIGRHLCSVANAYDLYDHAMFQTQVTEVRWSSDGSRWVVRTDRGDELQAKFIILGSGPLNRPKLPGIPGIPGVLEPGTPVGRSTLVSAVDIEDRNRLSDPKYPMDISIVS